VHCGGGREGEGEEGHVGGDEGGEEESWAVNGDGNLMKRMFEECMPTNVESIRRILPSSCFLSLSVTLLLIKAYLLICYPI
jgi:hypothetical protein